MGVEVRVLSPAQKMPEIYLERIPSIGEGNGIGFAAITREGETLGTVFGKLIEEDITELESIHVNDSSRRNGIGGTLLAAIFEWARDMGANRITGEFLPEATISPEEVERFYKKRGVVVMDGGRLEGNL